MYPMEEPFLQAEVAYRRERLMADYARSARRRRRRQGPVAGRHRHVWLPARTAGAGAA